MVWKTVNNTDPGTATLFGGDDLDKVSNLFNAVSVVDTVDIDSDWTFRSSRLFIRNPLNSFSYNIVASAITLNRNTILPLLGSDDTFLFEAHPATILSKTINLTDNTVTDNLAAAGDLARSNGTKYTRFARGTANQQIRVNAGGTDIEYFTPSSPGAGSYRLGKLEGATISTDRESLNWLDSSKINFTVTDDGVNDETEITATIVSDSIVNADINSAAGIDLSKLNDTGFLQGELIKHDGSNFIKLPKGSALQVLRVNASGTDLEYSSAGAGSINTTRLENVDISTGRIALNWLDSSKINFSLTDDVVNDETEITATIVPSSLVLGDIQNIATDRLLGRETAASGVIEEISLNTTLELTTATTLGRSAITGDISIPAGSNVSAISAGVIINADVNVSADIAKTKIANAGTWANSEIANLPVLGTLPSPPRQVAIVNAEISTVDASKITTGQLVNARIAQFPVLGVAPSPARQTNIVNSEIDAAAGIITTKLADAANFILSTLDNDFGSHFQDIDNLVTPANPPTNTRRIFVDPGSGELSVRTSLGATVSLEQGAAAQTTKSYLTWTIDGVGSEAGKTHIVPPNSNLLSEQASPDLGHQIMIPTTGTLQNMFVQVANSPGAGQSFTFTVERNGADVITVIISNAETTGSELVDTEPLAAGDRVSLKVVGSGAANQSGDFAVGIEAQ